MSTPPSTARQKASLSVYSRSMDSLPMHPKQAPILIYSKDYCPYCDAAKNLLTQKGVGYKEINLNKQPEERDEMLKKSENRTTVPQIFIGEQGVGGFDDIRALEAKGELNSLLFPQGQ